jgi:folate-binding protein YgfZ
MMESGLRERLEAAGAVFAEVAERPVARHFGDGAAEYRAVREAAGLAARTDLALFRMWGRDPVKMLNGLITNDLVNAVPGRGVYAAMLTPKGRTVAELRAFRREAAGGAELLIALPHEAAPGTREHFKKYVPPLFARWEDASDRMAALGLYGPRAAEQLQQLLAIDLPEPGEDAYLESDFEGTPVLVARSLEAGLEDGYEIFAPAEAVAKLWDGLSAGGVVRPVGFGALETLRVEAGRPRYGAELTEETIPTEAFQETGLLTRAISFTKGCYTGQEVIIRIAHRGHVNRHLRGLLLGDRPTPAPRTPLFHPDSGKQVGWTTSAAVSPRMGQTVALGYLRREVEPGGTVNFGGPDGEPVRVVRLPFGSAEL